MKKYIKATIKNINKVKKWIETVLINVTIYDIEYDYEGDLDAVLDYLEANKSSIANDIINKLQERYPDYVIEQIPKYAGWYDSSLEDVDEDAYDLFVQDGFPYGFLREYLLDIANKYVGG